MKIKSFVKCTNDCLFCYGYSALAYQHILEQHRISLPVEYVFKYEHGIDELEVFYKVSFLHLYVILHDGIVFRATFYFELHL